MAPSAPWHDFFASEVAATSALAGLLFVAISVNLARIMQFPWLPSRAGQTLIVLTSALIESSVALMPLSARLAAAVVGLFAAIAYATAWRLSDAFAGAPPQWRVRPDYRQHAVVNFTGAQLATLPALVGSIVGIATGSNGECWLAAGIVLSLVFGLYNAWILLIEILR